MKPVTGRYGVTSPCRSSQTIPPHDQFLRLYAECELALHTFVRSMLPTREEALEVMQEVIGILWQKFSQVDDFRPWAFGVARLPPLRGISERNY